jgi:hypothetical protein
MMALLSQYGFRFSLAALIALSACTCLLAGCHDGRDEHRAGFFTVSEQVRIEAACKALWNDANPNASWSDIAQQVYCSCEGSMHMDEAFLIAEYHPRTLHDWAWRGPFEAALFRLGSMSWNPPGDAPRCRLIRQALGLGWPPPKR